MEVFTLYPEGKKTDLFFLFLEKKGIYRGEKRRIVSAGAQ